MTIIIKDEKKWERLTRKIFKAQIVLDRFKKAVKIGQENINKLRKERDSLKE